MHGAADVEPVVTAEAPRAPRSTTLADTVLVIFAFIILWQLASWLIGRDTLPAPAATVRKLFAIMADEDFSRHAWETGRAFGTALVIALFGGLAIGLALGAHRLSGEVAEPILVALYSIPKITLYPVILLLFGLGISAKIAFGVIHGIIPVAIFTMTRCAACAASISAPRRRCASLCSRPRPPSSSRPRFRRSCRASAWASR